MKRRILYNAHVLTMEDEGAEAEAICLQGDRILQVGSNDDVLALAEEDSELCDIGGRTVIPGMIESHCHITDYAVNNFLQFLCNDVGCIDEVLELVIKKRESQNVGEWVLGYGFDDTKVSENRHVTRYDLDKACSDSPVFMYHISCHLAYANSKALELANITADTPIPEGGHGEIHCSDDGTPSGLLIGKAADLIVPLIPKYTQDELCWAYRKGFAYANSYGITSIQDGAIGWLENEADIVGSLQRMDRDGELNSRMYLTIMDNVYERLLSVGVKPGFGSSTLRMGSVKLFVDGSIQGHTAAVSEPYISDPNNKGLMHFSQEELDAKVEHFHKAGCQIAMHTNGDAAIERALLSIERAQKLHPREDSRHILIHCQMVSDEQLDRMAALGIIANFFVTHVYLWGDRHRDLFIGLERARRLNPVSTALEKGVRVCMHTDLPVTPINPFTSMYAAVARTTKNGDQLGSEFCVSPYEALKAWTATPAWSSFEEHEKGKITSGMLADLVVLSDNPLSVTTEQLKNISVLETIIGGKTVYSVRAIQE